MATLVGVVPVPVIVVVLVLIAFASFSCVHVYTPIQLNSVGNFVVNNLNNNYESNRKLQNFQLIKRRKNN